MVEDYGIQFINEGRQTERIVIDDYDKLHAIFLQKTEDRHEVNIKGRKIKIFNEDTEDVQDPMEKM